MKIPSIQSVSKSIKNSLTEMGLIMAVIPNTEKILKIFEPRIFPIVISDSF